MSKKNFQDSNEEFVFQYLKKNKDFLLKFPSLINLLDFPKTAFASCAAILYRRNDPESKNGNVI